MVAEYIIKEESAKQRRAYCNRLLKNKMWHSSFHGELYYKTTRCECGKESRIKVDFAGSDYDSWDGTSNWLKEFTKKQKNEKQ